MKLLTALLTALLTTTTCYAAPINTVWHKPANNAELYERCGTAMNATAERASAAGIRACMYKTDDNVCHIVASDCEELACFRVIGYALAACQTVKKQQAFKNFGGDLWHITNPDKE